MATEHNGVSDKTAIMVSDLVLASTKQVGASLYGTDSEKIETKAAFLLAHADLFRHLADLEHKAGVDDGKD